MAVKTEAAARKTEHPEHPSQEIPIALHGRELVPNHRIPLDVSWVEEVRVNTSAVERRAATIGTRRSVKKDWQAAWLLRAISCMDLTTLFRSSGRARARARGGRARPS